MIEDQLSCKNAPALTLDSDSHPCRDLRKPLYAYRVATIVHKLLADFRNFATVQPSPDMHEFQKAIIRWDSWQTGGEKCFHARFFHKKLEMGNQQTRLFLFYELAFHLRLTGL